MSPTQPRVVIVDHCAQLSGGEIALLRLLPHLRNHDPYVILAEDGPLVGELRAVGVDTEVLPMDERTRGASRHAGGVTDKIVAARDVGSYVLRLSRRFRELNPTVVHGNSLKAGYYGSIAARMTRRPFVWHLRDRLADDYMPAAKIRLTRTVMRKFASGVIAPSTCALETAALPAGKRPTRVVPDPYRRSRLVAARQTHADNVVVGMVGRLAAWKGQDVFLRAFAKLRATHANASARIIGSAMFDDAPFGRKLEELAAELGITDAVTFTGFRHDIEGELDRLDILVHASTVPEPFGQVIVEGLAAGLPVIASAAGGPLEVIQPGVTGLLYPPGDDAALAENLLALVDDASMRASLGDAGRQSIARFDPTIVAEQLEAFWTALAAR